MTAAQGWVRIGPLPALRAWAASALPEARRVLAAGAGDWRCGGTWFAGVDALPNGPDGAVQGARLPAELLARLPMRPAIWHAAQLSTTRPGYPRRGADETEAAHRYRLLRDAAHVDGLLPVGPDRRRMLREPHAFILGLPLTEADPGAAPLVVWEGSHLLIRQALAAVLAPHPPHLWAGIDLTEAYHAARRAAFAACRRRAVAAGPGEALLLHRMLLHGTAPWADGAQAADEGRMIAFFRPQSADPGDWLHLP